MDIGMFLTALTLTWSSEASTNARTGAPIANSLSLLASDNRSLILMPCSVFIELYKAKTITPLTTTHKQAFIDNFLVL